MTLDTSTLLRSAAVEKSVTTQVARLSLVKTKVIVLERELLELLAKQAEAQDFVLADLDEVYLTHQNIQLYATASWTKHRPLEVADSSNAWGYTPGPPTGVRYQLLVLWSAEQHGFYGWLLDSNNCWWEIT